MEIIELKNYFDWKIGHVHEEKVLNGYGYDYLHTYNFLRGKDHMFHFRSLEPLHRAQLERIVICYLDGENAGRREEKKAFQEQIGKTIDTLGLRPLLEGILRNLTSRGQDA